MAPPPSKKGKGEKRKRVVLSLEKKLEIVERLKRGHTQSQVSAEFGVGASTVSNIWKQRDDLKKFVAETTVYKAAKQRKILRGAKNEVVDGAVYLWFQQERSSRKTPISGDILMEKARIFNERFLADGTGGDPDFKASTGWLKRFKERHGIRNLSIQGEVLSSNPSAVAPFLEQLGDIIAETELTREQVYNCDETGLYWKVLPHRTLVGPEETSAPGHKKSKERLTLLATSNATGTHKLPLVLIGKAAKPRCFKNVNMAALPVKYRNQKNAWMDSQLFEDWFRREFVPSVRRHLHDQGLPEKAILLLDNAPAHPDTDAMQSQDGQIRCVFLPANTTPLLQPMDQGILEITKRTNRKSLIRKMLFENEDPQTSIVDFIKSLTIKDAVYMSAAAWDSVTQSSIAKCWRKLNLGPEEEAPEGAGDGGTDAASTASSETTSDPELTELVRQLPHGQACTDEEIQEWVDCDRDDPGWEMLNDDEIAETSVASTSGRQDDADKEDDSEVQPIEPPGPTHNEAMTMATKLMQWLERQPETDPTQLMLLKNIRDLAASKRGFTQRKITNFFKSS